MQRAVRNAAWSATKTRQYDPESRPRMPFRPSAIRGHSTVASNQSRHVLRAHRRVRVLWRWVRKSSRFDQSEPTSRHAIGGSIKGVCLHFSAFRSVTGTNSTSICERTRCERNENTSISSGVTDTNAISPRCNQGIFDGGATYRLELQCYHLAGTKEETTTMDYRPIRADLPACHWWIYKRRARLGHLYIWRVKFRPNIIY